MTRYKGYCHLRYILYRGGAMKKLSTFDDVLALWGTPKALSDDLGTIYVTAQLMKRRGSIGVDHWPKLIELLASRGYVVTTDDLLAMRQRKREAA